MSLDRLIYDAIRRGNISLAKFSDDIPLDFGSSKDVSVAWDGSALNILPLTDDVGSIKIGNGTKSIDLKWFGDSASKYALFDVGNSCITIAGLDLNFNVSTTGTYNITLTANQADALSIKDSTGDLLVFTTTTDALAVALNKNCQFTMGASASVVGSGMPLSATKTLAMGVYVDDGNASISSGTLTRAGRFRNLQVYTGGNREQEACGLIGQMVSVAGTNRHNMAGLIGSYEASTSLVVDGQAWGTDPWIQAAVLGRIGVGSAITTINANGILAGVAAMSNTTSFAANNGTYAAFFAGKWSGTVDWGYGLFIDAGAVSKAISVGTYASAIDTGMYLNGSTWNVGFFLDDSGDAQTASTVVRNVISRAYFTIDQTNAACDFDTIRGHIKAAAGVDFSGDTSTRACVRGYYEMAGATICGAGAFMSAIMGEFWGDGDITGTGLAAALMARIYTSAGSVTGTVAGVMVCKHFASTQTFTHGVYIQDGSVATGNDIRLMGGVTISSGSAEPTHSATQGSLYIRTGQAINATYYQNTNGTTGWTLMNHTQA